MTFKDDQSVFDYISANQGIPKWVTDARAYTKECCAYIDGECFDEELLKVDGIESDNRAKARKKYARDIRDFYERIFQPIQNVFSSTGGTKDYKNGDTQLSDADQVKLLSLISNVRDGKSIERYIETQWMKLYHTDPSGVQWLVYTTLPEGGLKDIYPTYQSISAIRNYIAKGQLTECIIFEPIVTEDAQYWTVVDDVKQYYVKQVGKDQFTIIPEKTFAHPFGVVPVIINSNIIDKFGNRLSPIDDILPISKEYARDLSIKTIYKFLQGFPKHWYRTMFCMECKGTRKNGDGGTCLACSGTGEIGRRDITDDIRLPEPIQGDPVLNGNDIMGFATPDLKTWDQYTQELEINEGLAYKTMWGCEPQKKVSMKGSGDGPKTATQIHYDLQPQINKLNKYADIAEWMEWMFTEWIANAVDINKDKNASISLIVYGRRFILEGIDVIQQKYEDAREAGSTIGILDAIYQELLTVKFKNDPEWMRIELIKARVEPYLHWDVEELNNILGPTEALRKIYFQQWWSDLTDEDLEMKIEGDVVKTLEQKFRTDFDAYLPTVTLKQPATVTPGVPDPATVK